MVPNVVKIREGWELYIVTDGVTVRILLGEGAHWAHWGILTVTLFITIYSSHLSLLFTILGTISACSYRIPDDGILKYRNM
jgi:hypothetical protein